jgi:hypothetical protein
VKVTGIENKEIMHNVILLKFNLKPTI